MLFQLSEIEDLERLILINNAGTLGDLTYIHRLSESQEGLSRLRSALDTNVTSYVWLSSHFLRMVRGLKQDVRADLVNISSLAAVAPFSSWGVYCLGKAARDMAMRVVAEEAKDIDWGEKKVR